MQKWGVKVLGGATTQFWKRHTRRYSRSRYYTMQKVSFLCDFTFLRCLWVCRQTLWWSWHRGQHIHRFDLNRRHSLPAQELRSITWSSKAEKRWVPLQRNIEKNVISIELNKTKWSKVHRAWGDLPWESRRQNAVPKNSYFLCLPVMLHMCKWGDVMVER